MSAVTVDHLTKRYGTKTAVDDLSFEVPEGQIVGFLGPNGAGKTTTIRMMLGLAKPTAGAISILGHDAQSAGNAVRRQIGFLPDVPGFPSWMTAPEFLRFTGSLFGLRGPTLEARVESLLDMAGLADASHQIGGFSRGMKQRLGVAQALVNAPRLLILDEPTSALDPLGRRDVLTMVDALRGKATVLFSTHLLDDVERVCDSAVILHRGRALASGPITDLRRDYGDADRIRLRVDGESTALVSVLTQATWAHDVHTTDGLITFRTDDPGTAGVALVDLLHRHGCTLREYAPQPATLEDVFVRLTQEGR